MKLKKSDILKQVNRLRCLPEGSAEPSAINQRLDAIVEIITKRARDYKHLCDIMDTCMEQLKWVPAPAEVREIIETLEKASEPFWEPPKVPKRCILDVLEDIKFQKQFAKDRPRLAEHAEAMLVELHKELAEIEESMRKESGK